MRTFMLARVSGFVQGIGFRPFVRNLAVGLGLAGHVRNTPGGAEILVAGDRETLDRFFNSIRNNNLPLCRIDTLNIDELDADSALIDLPPLGAFEIHHSRAEDGARKTALILPDIATCPDCIREMLDHGDRRYLYPFINCTHCGPRFTIITDRPYDRPNTTMAEFTMCADCKAEYDNPADRRYHAQPVACPVCGPQVELEPGDTGAPLTGADAINKTAAILRDGGIVAVKGIGGYHLAVDACNESAVERLRKRKNREEKPLAVMMRSLTDAGLVARIGPAEMDLLESPARPIVLLEKHPEPPIRLAESVAPGLVRLGVMLPYTPLHHLLMREFQALVMTSGNLADEPICTSRADARERLGAVADAFLHHNRRIHIRADDSIVIPPGSPARGRIILRRSRGYAPSPISLKPMKPARFGKVLAIGGELKNAFCLLDGDAAFLSPHVGDMSTAKAVDSLESLVPHFEKTFDFTPEAIACDFHPEYFSRKLALTLAERTGVQVYAVWHHHAHAVSAMAENGLLGGGKVIAASFDGAGYGPDGTIWGGEFLICDETGFNRAGSLYPVSQPGGDAAAREPERMMISYLAALAGISHGTSSVENDWKKYLSASFRARYEKDPARYEFIAKTAISAKTITTSCGRLFDAVSAIAGLRWVSSFEGQAAMQLEGCISPAETASYPMPVIESGGLKRLDTRATIRAILADVSAGAPAGDVSARFHNSLADGIQAMCESIRAESGIVRVVLSGGCFQNTSLTDLAIKRLIAGGFAVYTQREAPPNDGGLSLGQAAIVAAGGGSPT